MASSASDSGSIIGDVITHGKKKYWLRGGNFHYHIGLDAGDNTLEAQLARLLCRSLASHRGLDVPAFADEYIRFMTTPGSHNDTYAATAHRMFFANHVRGLPPLRCADNDGHNTDAIDALTLVIPLVVHGVAVVPRGELKAQARALVALTRRSDVLGLFSDVFVDLLASVLEGVPLREAVEAAGRHVGIPSVASAVERYV